MSKTIKNKKSYEYKQDNDSINNTTDISTGNDQIDVPGSTHDVGDTNIDTYQNDAATETDDEDVNKIFLFYPDGIDKTSNDKIYKLTDADLNMHLNFNKKGEMVKMTGQLRTAYLFPDTKIGDMRTWRFRFYDIEIRNIHIDSSSDYLIYDIESGGFDVND